MNLKEKWKKDTSNVVIREVVLYTCIGFSFSFKLRIHSLVPWLYPFFMTEKISGFQTFYGFYSN